MDVQAAYPARLISSAPSIFDFGVFGGDHITVVKNPNYWRAGEGLPRIDTVIFRIVQDTNQLLAQLLSGDCDIGTQDAAFDAQAEFLKQAEAEGLLKL